MDTEQIVAELRTWATEHRQELPRPIYDAAYLEHCGLIVDLDDGSWFKPRDDWQDFTLRWITERTRRGKPLHLDDLAAAIHKANPHGYDLTICRAIALTVLPLCADGAQPACAEPPPVACHV